MKDLTGERFGRWKVLGPGNGFKSKVGQTHKTWWCRCDCGEVKDVNEQNLKRGQTKSCGCLRIELITKPITHDGRTMGRNLWSEELGVGSCVVSMRLQRGLTEDKVFHKGHLPNGREHIIYEYDDKALSLEAWSELTGISMTALRSRIRRDWPLSRAFTEPTRMYTQGEEE